MHVRRIGVFVLLILAIASVQAAATGNGDATAQQTQRTLSPESVRLTAGEFFTAWKSQSEKERYDAEIYLLGVMDTTEGTVWCSYSRFKTISLHTTVYEYIKKLPEERLKESASSIIIEALSEFSNLCKKSDGNKK